MTVSRIRHGGWSRKGFPGTLIEPIDWLSETIFSILIFLTFTLAFRMIKTYSAAPQPVSSELVNELIITALGAVLAWGAIDGIMYALFSVFERGERHRLLRDIQTAPTRQQALEAIAEDMDYLLEPITGEAERKELYGHILIHLQDSNPRKIGLKFEDLTMALGHVLVAVLAVIPSVLPFLVFRNDPDLAIRVSIVISFLVLFLAGSRWGAYTGASPWKTGLLLTVVAAVLLLIAIPLGG